MNNQPTNIPERILELLIRRSTEGISQAEHKELLREIEESADRENLLREIDRLDFTAAAIGLTDPKASALSDSTQTNRDKMDSSSQEEMPAALRDSILLEAGKFFAQGSNTNTTDAERFNEATKLEQPNRGSSKDSTGPSVSRSSVGANRFTMREALGWLAAAAAILILLTGFNPFAEPNTGPSNKATATGTEGPNQLDQPDQQIGKVAMTPAQQYQALLDSPPEDLIQIPWTAVHDSDAAGEVVWSDKLQKGFMCFSDLDINDAKLSQYQLWIFDTNVDQPHPVDGGVFDIDGSEPKAIVAIDAKILVKKAVQFAVTVEEPGGVVVSKREKIPVLATVAL